MMVLKFFGFNRAYEKEKQTSKKLFNMQLTKFLDRTKSDID